MSRSVPEWIGKTDDQQPPDRVRVRVPPAYGFTLSDIMPRVEISDDGCWLWKKGRNGTGYGCWPLPRKYGHGSALAHRLAFEITRGPIPNGMYVCHKCDRPLCVNPDHLFLGTQFDNMRDCSVKGRAVIPSPRGERHPNSKLTDADIRAIRSDPSPQRRIAEAYGLSFSHVSAIKLRKSWGHVP